MLTLFEIAASLLALSALFGWINHVFVKLPHTIGMLAMALVASISLLAAEQSLALGNWRDPNRAFVLLGRLIFIQR